jgi:hypothetical protein
MALRLLHEQRTNPMKVKITSTPPRRTPPVTVTITLKYTELERIVNGLGNTSPDSRVKAGMTPEQSAEFFPLFSALSDALDDFDVEYDSKR